MVAFLQGLFGRIFGRRRQQPEPPPVIPFPQPAPLPPAPVPEPRRTMFPTASIQIIYEYLAGIGTHSKWDVLMAALDVLKWAAEFFRGQGQVPGVLPLTIDPTEADLKDWAHATVSLPAGTQALSLPPAWLVVALARLILKLAS